MKQRCDKIILIKFIAVVFVVCLGFFVCAFAQYYYFSSGGKAYQQGCNEKLEIRVNSQGKDISVGLFHLILDPLTTIYTDSDVTSELRDFFAASSETFIDWSAPTSPMWQEGSNHTILEADRNHGVTFYNGASGLYAEVNFKPVFSGSEYDVVFGMEYDPDAPTEQTALGVGGSNIINSEWQNLNKTGRFLVLQEPCVVDTYKPTITNISFGSTKVSHLSGLTFWLKDDNGTGDVPYIWSDGGEWTGNVGGIISNQYGIDPDRITIELSGNGVRKIIINTSTGVNIEWSGKTWQNHGLNAKVSVESGGLFDFGIEKEIIAKFTFYDRTGKHDTKVITFNKPKGPELISNSVSPKNNDIYVNLSAPIKLGIKDDWAGVNSGSISIKIYGINNTEYGPYIFSGADLNLSGVHGNANEPDYYINITNHGKFPTSGTIKVEVYAEDMEGTTDNIDDYSFFTRPDCTEFQCCDPVWLDLGNEGDTYYYNTGLIISGGNNPSFSGDEQNITGVIDCNAETDGLSVYSGQDNFVFFTDESVLTILGTGVKGVLSGDVLTLNYIIDDLQVVIDKPYDTESLSTGEVDIQWHLTGAENQDDWLSGYVVQISGKNFNTGLFVSGTGITEILPDGEYEIIIYPVDVLGHTGNTTTGTFIIDTTGPDFEFKNRSGYECEAGYLEITSVNDLLSSVSSLPYRFNGGSWTGNSRFDINSQNITGFVSVTGSVQDYLGNISEESATYEFIDTGISVNNSNISLSVLTGNYVTGIANIYESFGVTEGNCGTGNLSLEIDSCAGIGYEGNIVGGNLVITPNNYYEGNGECNLVITDDDGNHENISLSFEIDTKFSSCALVIPLTQQCTSGTIELLLTGDDDISGYRWNLGDEWLPFGSSISTGVYGLGIYTGYVIDGNGNESECIGEVAQNIFDNNSFTINVIQATGYECQTITGYVQAATGESCGKKNLSDFTYNWNNSGYSNNLSYGIYSGESGVQNISVYVQDLVGNTENVIVSYIWYDSEIQFNNIERNFVGNSVQVFNWKDEAHVVDGDCGSETVEFSGFISTGSHGTCVTGDGDTIIYTPNIGVQYEGEDSCTFEIRDDEGNTQTVTINLGGVDTKKPECSISYNDTVCTSGSISLTMSTTGATRYSWTGFTGMITENLSHNVNGNRIYTGYVKDVAGNVGICTGEVVTFDNIAPVIGIPAAINLTAEECTLIQGNIGVVDDGGCGDGFTYLWGGFGYGSDTYYSGYSELVTGKKATVFVRDLAGNVVSGTINYNWTDTGVQLNNGNVQTISTVVLTGGNSYNTTTGGLISLFGASEGNCGPKYISVEKISCDGLSMDIDVEGNVVVTGSSSLSDTGSCTLKFNDNDGNSEIGTFNIMVDTVAPGITLEGTNEACMSTNTFDVTGIFTEFVQGFTLGNVFIQNGSGSNFGGEGSGYTWKITMDSMVEVQVSIPAGVAIDLNGTENTASNVLTGMYDNVGPNDVNLVEKTTVYSESTNFSWGQTIDSGCAEVSGYQRELYLSECSGLSINSGYTSFGTENIEVSGLENTKSYCRRVRPIDNFGNMGNWAQDSFYVDLSSIGCNFVFDANCTSGTIQVTLRPDRDYTANGDIYLSWQETGDRRYVASLSTGVTFSGQVLTGYIYQPDTAKSNSCVFVASTIDTVSPEIISVNIVPVPECATGTATVTEISDEGCGEGVYTYSWNGEGYGNNTSFQRYFGVSGTRNIDLRVKDNVGNESDLTGIVFTWTNEEITANDFTGSDNVGNSEKTTNWRINSNAIDGSCGSGAENVIWSGFISIGGKGECIRNGDNITYTPKPNQTGEDMCEIELRDDEGSTVKVKIYWEGIDTVAPTCSIAKEPETCRSGSVLLTLTADEALSQVVGGDVAWGISENTATGSVNINGDYTVEITDLAGNIGSCSGTIDYISTGVLERPTISISTNSGYTNDNTLDISWNPVSANRCRYASGYEVQIISAGVEVTGWITDGNSWTSPELSDGEYTIKVRTLDNLGGKSDREQISVIIDTDKPTCTFEFNDACTGGQVLLSMMAPDAKYYSWIGFEDMSDSKETIGVDTNGTYYCYVQDLAGNTGSNSIVLDNIKVLPLSAPNGLVLVGGTPISNNTPAFEWIMPVNDGCRVVSGFELEILSGGTPIYSDIVSGNGWTSGPLDDGEYIIRIRTLDNLGGESEWNELSFVVDTTAPICEIKILTQQCTNSGVDIKLSGNVSDIVKYSWWSGSILNFGDTILTTVFENGIYTGYVYDLAGNQGICTGVVGTGIQDQMEISYNKQNPTGYECEFITGSVLGVVSDSCGKDDLNKFTYVRDGGINASERGIISNDVSTSDVDVIISDGAGNSTGTTVTFTWNDTGVSLTSGTNQSIGVLTGNFEMTVLEIIDLFDATEGLCGKNNISVSGDVCSGASISIVAGSVVINPNNNLDGSDGYCKLDFTDDEGEKITIGMLEFVVDTVAPGIVLEGTNEACMSTNTFDVTGTFTEPVQGFSSGNVDIHNGSISNFGGEGVEYTWEVIMNPMVEVSVSISAGVATDLNGIENTASTNELTGMYDNVGPNSIIFNNWKDTIFTTETILSWNTTTDSGCAGLSGYYYKFVQGTFCNNGNFDFITDTSISVSDLLNDHNYTLCVVPVDNFGNTGDLTRRTFVVDLDSIGCVIEEVPMCSSTGVTLILKPGEGIEGDISLSRSGYDDLQSESQLTRTVTESGLLVTGYIQQNSGGKEIQGHCSKTVQNIDKLNPTIISVIQATGYECQTITGSIEMTDEGCGQGEYVYEWNSLEPLGNTWYSDYSPEKNEVIIYVTGYDSVGNSISTGVNFVWYNSPIERNNFTGSVNIGNESKTINWRDKSNVSDGICGSGTIYYLNLIKTGDKGECTVNGDEVTYTPSEEMVGNDDCIIRVEDDEGGTGDIIVYWEGIDTQKPTCSLVVQGGQSCTSGTVILSLDSESSDVLKYSFDGETRSSWVPNITTGVISTGIYTGYVKDIVGNIGICIGIVDTGILDKDNPTMIISNWSGFECSTGFVVVTGFDYSCGFEGLYYLWEGFSNNTNRNEIYSGKVGSQIVAVTVFDGVGHSLSNQAAYIWNNIPVTGQNFVVQNVGTGIIVDWKSRGNVHAGDCEEVFVSAIDNQKCATGDNNQLRYSPVQGQTGSDTCILTISDDDGVDTIVAIFEGIDMVGPTVQLGGGVGTACTNEETFVVTGIFSEQVHGVSLSVLTGENVEIKQFAEINGTTYRWVVEMKGGTGKVWINDGVVGDGMGNYNEGSNVLVLGNYDIWGPSSASLVSPSEGKPFDTNSINFEWTSAIDEGCVGEVLYILEICNDIACQNVIRYETISGTGKTEGSLPNGVLYWRVITSDSYGNTGESSPIQSFIVSSEDPNCTIVEQNFCVTGNVVLTLTGDRNVEIVNNGGVSWYGTGDSYTGEIGVNGEIIVVVKDDTGRTGQCSLSVSKHDNTGPTFTFDNNSGYECVSGSLSITDVSDNGGCAGLSNTPYKFGAGNWGTITIYNIAPQQPGLIIITGYVRDALGNQASKTAEYTIINVEPTANNFSTGNIGSRVRVITLAKFIEASNASEGQCGTGDLLFSGVKVNGNKGICTIARNILTYTPNPNNAGSDSCIITITDNEDSTKDVTVTFDDIDTVAPVCTSWIVSPGGWTSGDSVIITLTGCSEPISGDIQHEFRENTGYTFNYRDFLGNTGSLFVEYTGFDREPPIFEFNDAYGYECQTGMLTIEGAVDSGIGLRSQPYSFDGINWINESTKVLYSDVATGIFVSGYVRDGLGNRSVKQAKYVFQDSEPTATGFTVAAMNGVDVNRKILSNATDGACGSGTLEARVRGGEIGNCTVSGDILSYKPKDGYVIGTDICELTIIDDEGSVVSGIIVKFTDINKYPYVRLLKPDNGKILSTGFVNLSWEGVGDTDAIDKYVVTIRDAREDWVEELTGNNFSINLRKGSYRWNVYAVFKDGKTGGLSSTYSFYIVSIPFGNNEGLSGVKLVKDKCPDGDFSDSYYDTICDFNGGRHGSAETDMCGVNMSDYSTEQKGAYLYSYMYGITTMCPIGTANLDGYLIRSHFAKMISEFAVNVLGMIPETGKKGCDEFDDISSLNSELYRFAIISCELGLMGLEADGVTPAKSFNPGNYVTRAQFGTVLSRLLFGDTYNVKDESNVGSSKGFWYKNHLEALKSYGVMTKIDGDWPNYLERRGRVMIMLQRADNYGIFAGKVPAKNGVSALFDD